MQTFLKHTLLWISIYVIYTYMMSYYDDLKPRMAANVVNVALFMAAYYLLKHVQIPYLYNRGKMGYFVLSIAISAFIISAICRINGILWMDAYFGKEGYIPFMTIGSYLLKTVRFYTPAMAILAWESHQERRKEKERIQLLEKEKLTNELKFLKAQINPHFLFNTFNNLYSYVVNQSPKAPDMIMQLSGILDYVLYKSQEKEVLLSQEVNTIEHFLKLEQIRYGERLEVSFQTDGDMSVPISPLILLSIVENAFKHGVSGDIDFPKIDIEIKGTSESIYCRAWNTKSKLQGEINDAYKEGIGLSNIKRQLNLVYPQLHELTIDDLEDSFCLSLSINLLA
ncbi:MAG: sensor histidine kinase [Chitinophagales bacterium]|nr:sensor histidine kinase [Chitinophagales bacterium]